MSTQHPIKQFIGMNRAIASKLEIKYPKIFHGSSYLDELLMKISEDIDRHSPSSVVEVGGIDRPLLEKGRGYKYT